MWTNCENLFLPHSPLKLRAMQLDSLRVKLFLAIAGGTAVLALAAYLVFSWSFDRGFVEYVNRADEARLEPLIERLGEEYARRGDWKWVAEDRRRWFELLRETLDVPPVTIDPRLMLFDANGSRVFARPESAAKALLKPIERGGKTVGYLGYIPRPDVLESIERLYLQRQHLTFGAIGIGMLMAALLLGAGLSHWLSRRIRNLEKAARSLSEGNYDVRLEVRGRDELSLLARDFNALAEALAAAQRARRQWIADIAHELRTPLSILRGEIEALQDGVRPLDRDAVNSLSGEAARLARLVEDLHTLSLSDLGALTYRKEPVDIAELAAEAIDAQRPALEQKGLRVKTDLAPAMVSADAGRIAQVFGNLMQNTLRYTDAPGILQVAARADADRVIVQWEDSSPGVPEDELPRLTERLYRLDSSRSRANGGSGLGLAIADAIVHAHGGTLTAHPSALGGLLIRLEFPQWRSAS
jgi:two-component system sensor histidine kinase BaeS